MLLKEALVIVKTACEGYSQDCIGSDEDAKKELDAAWAVVSKAAKKLGSLLKTVDSTYKSGTKKVDWALFEKGMRPPR